MGFSNAAAGLVDLRDMEAVVRVQFDATKEEFALDLGNGDELPEENGVVNRKQKSKKVEVCLSFFLILRRLAVKNSKELQTFWRARATIS